MIPWNPSNPSQKSKLNFHIKNTHQGSSKCHLCHKSLQVRNLKIHLKEVHVGVQDYICEFCGKSFSRANCLKEHIHSVHEGKRNKKCDLCDKSFSIEYQLKLHLNKIHQDSGTKSKYCELCGKSVLNLKSHILEVHLGHTDHKCESSGKSFT